LALGKENFLSTLFCCSALCEWVLVHLSELTKIKKRKIKKKEKKERKKLEIPIRSILFKLCLGSVKTFQTIYEVSLGSP